MAIFVFLVGNCDKELVRVEALLNWLFYDEIRIPFKSTFDLWVFLLRSRESSSVNTQSLENNKGISLKKIILL